MHSDHALPAPHGERIAFLRPGPPTRHPPVRLSLEVNLEYEVRSEAGADMILNIHAAHTAYQHVRSERLILGQQLTPEIATDPSSAARFIRLHADKGPLHVSYRAIVDLQHHRDDPGQLPEVPVHCLPLEVMPFVYPSRYCQSDRLQQLASDHFGALPRGYSRVLAIQDWVRGRVRFSAGSSSSATSALDTLVDLAGVCRDFAHLMIALCRAASIPARIATGTDYGSDALDGPPDFHAYVEAYLGGRWYIFDPSGIGIPMGFLRLGTGRDAADVAFATIFGEVTAGAPRVRVRSLEADGFARPHHTAEALSTWADGVGEHPPCRAFDARSMQPASNRDHR